MIRRFHAQANRPSKALSRVASHNHSSRGFLETPGKHVVIEARAECSMWASAKRDNPVVDTTALGTHVSETSEMFLISAIVSLLCEG